MTASETAPRESEYLPEIYEEFRRDYPSVARAYDALGDALHEVGPLDQRTRRLVKLGIAVGMCSEGAVRSHVRKGLLEGIAREDLEQVILLSLTTAGFPTVAAALKWAREVFDAQK